MKDKTKKGKRKFYERIIMQAERTHTYKQREGDTEWKMKRMQQTKVRNKEVRKGKNKE
jgi:hypothetical protein